MNLPQLFRQRMKKQLQEEYEAFIQSYEQVRLQGLRVNSLKTDRNAFAALSPFSLTQIPWEENGYYYPGVERPGKHPYFEAGLYYIQEPSAMAVAGYLDPKPDERVLDLCAAPGGKTTQIASGMENRGLLVSNEIHTGRAKILSQNVERMGIANTVVTNETPKRLAERFPDYFDRILVDAPCSGEGMFRKDPNACEEWSPENVKMCADRQLEILLEAQKMLRQGGRLVYSTCTFSPEENEGTISRFVELCPWMEILPMEKNSAFSSGRAEWIQNPAPHIAETIRIWPHRAQGEGHFIAVLRKSKEEQRRNPVPFQPEQKFPSAFYQFAEETLSFVPAGGGLLFGEHLYCVPSGMPELKGLKVIRPGLHLGTLKKNRFEPSHALAQMLRPEQANGVVALSAAAPEIFSYLRGEVLQVPGVKGWNLVTVDGYSLGWGKWSGGVLKNHYPKGLRWQACHTQERSLL